MSEFGLHRMQEVQTIANGDSVVQGVMCLRPAKTAERTRVLLWVDTCVDRRNTGFWSTHANVEGRGFNVAINKPT